MDEMQTKIVDDSVALNSMMNSVRARHLIAYRRRCLVNWKKRECVRMKSKIAEMQMKIKRLIKQKRSLDTVLAKDINKRSSVEAPMMMLLSSLKSQCVERKKRVDALRIEMAQFVEQHRAAWNRADSAMKNSPRMALVEDLKKELAGLKEERDRNMKEKSAKKLAAQKDKEIFQQHIVEFAEMMAALKKSRELFMKNKALREKLKLKKSFTPQETEQRVENLGYPGINFGIYDVELDESDGEPSVQEYVNGDGEFDLNCSVLSLGASVDGVGLTFGSSLGMPNAASTPYGGTELNQAMIAEEDDGNPEPGEEEVQEPMMVEAEFAKEDDVQEVQDVSENIANNSEEIDYRAKYAKSPENFPISAATSPQTTLPPVSTGFNFLSTVQEATGVGSLFGFGPAEPNASSIFNLF